MARHQGAAREAGRAVRQLDQIMDECARRSLAVALTRQITAIQNRLVEGTMTLDQMRDVAAALALAVAEPGASEEAVWAAWEAAEREMPEASLHRLLHVVRARTGATLDQIVRTVSTYREWRFA